MSKNTNLSFLTDYITADITNGRIGINNASPTVAFDVTGVAKFSSSVSATSFNATTTNIFSVDGSEKMRITSGGLVGIGTTAPNYTLHIDSNATLTRFQITNSTTGQGSAVGLQIIQNSLDTLITNRSNGYLGFETNSIERMRIDSAGNLGFGVTPFTNTLSKGFDLVGGGGMFALNNSFYLISNSYYNTEWRYKATAGACGVNLNSDGSISFASASSGTINTAIAFTTKMTISTAGYVLLGTYTAAATNPGRLIIESGGNGPNATNNGLEFVNSNSASGYGTKLYTHNSSDYFGIATRFNSVTWSERFIINQITGNVTINSLGSGAVTATSGVLSTTSDMTLKVEDGFIDNALEKISQLKPRYFYWKEESGLPTDIRQLGFYAQEVNQALGEEAANTPKNENDKWGIYDRGIIAMLTKGIQELKAEIETLKNK